MRLRVHAHAVEEDGDLVAEEPADDVARDGAHREAALHADDGVDCFHGGAEAAGGDDLLGHDVDAGGDFAEREAEARAGGRGGVERQREGGGFFGHGDERVEFDGVVGGLRRSG